MARATVRREAGSPSLNIVVLALVLGLLGAAVGDAEGMLAGALLGALAGMVLDARKRMAKLEAEQHALLLELRNFRLETERRFAQRAAPEAVGSMPAEPSPRATDAAARDAQPGVPSQVAEQEALELAAQPAQTAVPPAYALDERGHPLEEPAPSATPPPTPAPWQAPPALEPASPGPFEGLAERLRDLLFGGNTIVRVGILVLLVGVSLLLRWAAEHSVFPIELRMASAALIAIALVAVGYRQRELRPGFGRTLQGGGVAALYLVVFFSFRSYGLLPGGMAFALLVCIAISSGLLAVLQDAKALIVIGQVGGFMAPVLASTGGGSHVALFSYYLLLNVLVFVVAWFKPWRALNLVGFAFTFGIGSTWGALRYRPGDFASTEPFLIAFFLLYSLIPVLYALRPATQHTNQKRGWVDASLVFGTPLAVLLLQYAMVKDMPFGMAYSALGLSAFYVVISRLLLKRAPTALRSLVEAFLAIGVGFATLAVPYGFDNHDLTGASWALEGAGLYWVGTRQNRWISRLAGASLQLMAAGALIVQLADGYTHHSSWPLANARFLASTLLSLACLFVAQRAHANRAKLLSFEVYGLQSLIVLGLGFFVGAALNEVDLHVAPSLAPGATLAVLLASALLLELCARRLGWLPGQLPAVLLMLLLLPALYLWELDQAVHPLGRGGFLAFPLCLVLCLQLLRHFVSAVPFSAQPLHCVFLWFASGLLALESLHLVSDFAHLNLSWSTAGMGLSMSLSLIACVRLSAGTRWPFRAAPMTYLLPGGGALAIGLLFWSLWLNSSLAGDSAPLPYLPLLNPVDIAQLVAFVAMLFWRRELAARSELDVSIRALLLPTLGALGFFWFNALLARSVHQLATVPFDPDALWASTAMQVSLSVSWTLLGLLGTVLGSKRRLRGLWLLSATLLGITVLKLFTVDLAQLSTIAKIGTFMVVGLLLVLVGFFAPVPPPRSDSGNDGKLDP